jgi:tetratricopeptide (TPR) repeat protein
LGKILEKTGNPEEALQLLENLVIANEADADVLLMFIQLKQKLFGSRSVIPLLEDLRKEFDFDDSILEDLAEAYFEVGEFDKAQREALEVLKTQPDHSRMKIILAKINHQKGQLDLAIHYCVEAIADEPNEIDGYLTLAEVYIERREISDALGVYKQAIRMNPENHLPYYHAGLLLRETKDYKEAEIMLKHAARLAPDGLQIRRQLGAVVALNLVHNAQEEKIAS